ncbi:hypothetical protein JW930_07330 [Candidatus Woesearchaeota archaeon]|nr:hypothetical protein [Candidatus Woesearchaeota archaeon]
MKIIKSGANMWFDKQKAETIKKMLSDDRSKKGSVDEDIKYLVDSFNSHDNFYTTSSCSGRIMLLKKQGESKKCECEWLFCTHSPIQYKDISKLLDTLPSETIYFRMESPIIHLCARDLSSAEYLLKSANNAGLRRCAVIALGKRIIIEISPLDRIDVPVAENSRLLVDKVYIDYLIDRANRLLIKTRKKMKRLYKELFSDQHCDQH